MLKFFVETATLMMPMLCMHWKKDAEQMHTSKTWLNELCRARSQSLPSILMTSLAYTRGTIISRTHYSFADQWDWTQKAGILSEKEMAGEIAKLRKEGLSEHSSGREGQGSA